MNDRASLSLFELMGVVLIDTVIPVVIVICFVVVFIALWRAKRIPNVNEFRHFLNAIGLFVFALALPFVAFPAQLILELSRSSAFNDILLVITTATIGVGTYCLVKGLQQLRAKADAA